MKTPCYTKARGPIIIDVPESCTKFLVLNKEADVEAGWTRCERVHFEGADGDICTFLEAGLDLSKEVVGHIMAAHAARCAHRERVA